MQFLKVSGTMLLLIGFGATRVCAIPPVLPEAVPADPVAAYFFAGSESPPARVRSQTGANGPNTPRSSTGSWSTVQTAAFLAVQAEHLGLLAKTNESTRIWIDSLITASLLVPNPHALVLFDVRARRRDDGGHELAGLSAALITVTHGANEAIEQRIQQLLNTYANNEETVLTNRSVSGGSVTTIHDRRLPPWASMTWGALGDFYIVTIGDGIYDRLARLHGTHGRQGGSLANAPWFAGAFAQLNGSQASFALYADLARLRNHVDPALMKKIENVQTVLGLGGTEQVLWTQATSGRSVEMAVIARHDGRDTVRILASDRLRDRLPGFTIPKQVGGYAVIDCDPLTVLRSVCDAYLKAKSARTRERKRAFWHDFEERAGVSMQRDVFLHLHGPVVVHDYPRHALGLPLAWTLLIPISGDPECVRHPLDRWLEEASQRLAKKDGIQLHHDADGVWYTQYGLTGPALAVTRRYLVVSFSPAAVRLNVAFLSSSRPSEAPGTGAKKKDR